MHKQNLPPNVSGNKLNRRELLIKREYSQNTICVEKMVYSAIETTCFGLYWPYSDFYNINPLNAELIPICHFLALLGGATILVVSRLRVKKESIQAVTTVRV